MASPLAVSRHDRIRDADAYLAARTGCYAFREVRYRAAAGAMMTHGPLMNDDTLFDVGCGWTEFDYYLREKLKWRGRYIPVDACIDGVDLDRWEPPREAEWFVALEVLEHMEDPRHLLRVMRNASTKGIVLSTPNPATTDVLGMDPTHRTPIPAEWLQRWGFIVQACSFYGERDDSLLAVWTR